MNTRTDHRLPPLLAAMAAYTVDQPRLHMLESALDAARAGVQRVDNGDRVSIVDFVEREGHSDQLATLTQDQRVAAVLGYGEAGYFLGLATCWLLLYEKGGAR
jgi:hypothetical protein